MLNNKKIICTDKDKIEYQINVSQLRFRPSVYGIIIENKKILLARQWDGYDYPGGGINLGEKIEEALTREVKEETGFDVAAEKLIGCCDDFHKMFFDADYVQSILIYYRCRIEGGKLSKNNFDHAAHENEYLGLAEWVDLADIKNIKFYNSVNNVDLINKAIQWLVTHDK